MRWKTHCCQDSCGLPPFAVLCFWQHHVGNSRNRKLFMQFYFSIEKALAPKAGRRFAMEGYSLQLVHECCNFHKALAGQNVNKVSG
jgi:hypothetical protein